MNLFDFKDSEINRKALTKMEAGIPSEHLQSGELSQNLSMTSGEINVTGGILKSSGDTIVDSIGLDSNSNFLTDRILSLSDSTTSTSYVAVTGGTMASFTLERQAFVLVLLNVRGRCDDAVNGNSGWARIRDLDAAATKVVLRFFGFDNASWNSTESYSNAMILSFAAGTHTLELQFFTEGGTAYISDADIAYTVLGK